MITKIFHDHITDSLSVFYPGVVVSVSIQNYWLSWSYFYYKI